MGYYAIKERQMKPQLEMAAIDKSYGFTMYPGRCRLVNGLLDLLYVS
jgi:hypothetical protein